MNFNRPPVENPHVVLVSLWQVLNEGFLLPVVVADLARGRGALESPSMVECLELASSRLEEKKVVS